MINFTNLKNLYNNQINQLLSDDGLTTNCTLIFGVSKKNICPNCIFDSQSNKSSNQYKAGGPTPFPPNRLCPYCHGIGFSGEEIQQENIYLAVIWDSKKWLNLQSSIKSPENFIQTICHHNLLQKIQSANYIRIKNQKYQIYGKPNYAGLGDNNYIITYWEIIT